MCSHLYSKARWGLLQKPKVFPVPCSLWPCFLFFLIRLWYNIKGNDQMLTWNNDWIAFVQSIKSQYSYRQLKFQVIFGKIYVFWWICIDKSCRQCRSFYLNARYERFDISKLNRHMHLNWRIFIFLTFRKPKNEYTHSMASFWCLFRIFCKSWFRLEFSPVDVRQTPPPVWAKFYFKKYHSIDNIK